MKKIILFILLTLSVALYSEITIEHNEPYLGYKGTNLNLDITIDGNWQEVIELLVYYRERGSVAFNSINVEVQSAQNGDYRVVIPISETAKGLEYYIEVKTKLEEVFTYPQNQPNLNPIMVQIIDKVISNDFVILNELTDIEDGSDLSLSISLFNIRDELDYNSITFYKDGRNVTKEVIITPTLLVYNVNKIRRSFNFQITAKTLSGELLDSGVQKVNVKQKMFTYDLPYNIRGNVNYKGNTNKISDDNNESSERATNTHSTIINASGNYKFVKMNTRLYLSSLEASDRQAVNRYSFDVSLPHFNLYLGDKTPYLSEFTLNSSNIRGFGSRLGFKYFLLEGYWGNTAREVSTKEMEEDNYYIPGTFKRETGAIRLSLGNRNAFQFGINVVKNKDRISSLNYSDYYIPLIEGTKADSTDKQIINPIDNIVLSTDFNLSSPSKLFNLGAELAFSAYNSNIIDGAISEDELDDIGADLPFDPESLDGFFVINKNTEPLSLSSSNLAYKLYSSMYIAGNLFSINYTRVGSAFNSTSAKNINTDTQEFSLTDNMNFHNTLFLDFSYNRVNDNLSDNLATTNEYSNYRINSIIRREKFPILRFSYNKGRTSIENNDEFEISDAFDEAQEFKTTAYGGGIGYDFDMVPLIPFSLDLDYQNSLDEDDLRDAYSFENISYYLRYRSKLTMIPLSTEVSYNLTNSTGYIGVPEADDSGDILYAQEEQEWDRTSIRLKIQYELVRFKLLPFFDYRLTNNENKLLSGNDNSYSATSLGLSYYPFRLTSLTTSLTFKNKNYDVEGSDYSAVNWYLNIVQKF